MSIADEILRLQGDSTDIAAAIAAKGVSVPQGAGFDDYASLIASIPSGGVSYVTQNLVLHLMGEDASASSWVDRINGYTFTLENCVKGENYVQFNGSNSIGYCANCTPSNIAGNTLEIVFSIDGTKSTTQMIVGFPPSASGRIGIMICLNSSGQTLRAYAYGNESPTTIKTLPSDTYSYNSIVSLSNYGQNNVMVNGTDVSVTPYSGSLYSANAIASLGGRRNPGTNNPMAGKIYQVRLYSRYLTLPEIYHNYYLDKIKYGI